MMGQFSKNVFKLTGGTLIAYSISMLAVPVLSRIFPPEIFGMFAVYTAIASIILSFSTLRFDLAIPLGASESEAANTVAITFVSVGVTFLFTLIGALLLSRVGVTFGLPKLPLRILPFSVAISSIYQGLSYWAARCGHFPAVARTKIWQSGVRAAVQTSTGILGFRSIGLIIGDLLGRVVGIRTLWRSSPVPWQDVTYKRMICAAQKHKHFPTYNLFGGFISCLGNQIPVFMLANYFSNAVAGQFSLTLQVLSMPAMVIGQALAQVFYPTVAKQAAVGGQVALINQLAAKLLIISPLVFGFIAIEAKGLFTIFLGNEWAMAGEFANSIAIWSCFAFIAAPLALFVLVKDRQKHAFFVTFYEAGLRTVAMVIGVSTASAKTGVILLSISGVLISLIYIEWMLRLNRTSLTEIIKRNWASLLKMAGGLGIASLMHLLIGEPFSIAVSAIILGIAALSIRHELKGLLSLGEV